MSTFRIRSDQFRHTLLLDAGSAGQARLFGGLYLLVHRLIDDLDGAITAEPWNASVEPGEYVPSSFFARIVPQLATLLAEADVPANGDLTSGTASGESGADAKAR